MRNLVGATAFMLLVGVLRASQATAAGAIAVGIAPGGAQNGYSSGFVVNAPNYDTAKERALARCKKTQENASGTPADSGTRAAQARCEVVTQFAVKCYAWAADPRDGTPGAGWAVADTQDLANDEAMARCRATAGAARTGFCKVLSRGCDGK
jgi:hypothetical protein